MSVFVVIKRLDAEPVALEVLRDAEHALGAMGTVDRLKVGEAWVVMSAIEGLTPAGPHKDRRGLMLLAGDPLCTQEGEYPSEADSVAAFMHMLPHAAPSALAAAKGSFCGVYLQHSSGEVLGFVDRLGVRPLYWSIARGHLYLANTAALLADCARLSAQPDWRGVAETAAFGYPLGDRTPHAAVKSLPSACLLVVENGQVVVRQWMELGRVAVVGGGEAELVDRVQVAFHRAVKRRLRTRRRVFAFLSGGMDSRLVASSLLASGAKVSTINFAPPGTQDLVYGRQMAARLGTDHFEYLDSSSAFADRPAAAIGKYIADPAYTHLWPDAQREVWSGDGGSVGLGHVYLSESIIRAARHGGVDAAARQIAQVNKLALPQRMFTSEYAWLSDVVLEGVTADLAARPWAESGRNCHLFFMLNDQRRHLADHFERQHRSRIELVLPFFDADFVDTVLAAPINPFLNHHLYNLLMMGLKDGCDEVPWQSYPGHEPCPIAAGFDGRNQWTDGWLDPVIARKRSRAEHLAAVRSVFAPEFPGDVVRRQVAVAAGLAGACGVHRFDYWSKSTRMFANAAGLLSPALVE